MAVVEEVAAKTLPTIGADPAMDTTQVLPFRKLLASTVFVVPVIVLFVNVCVSVVPTNAPVGAVLVRFTADVPFPINTEFAVNVAKLVPPLATATIPVTLPAVVAVVAFPERLAVMVPAEKLPDPSRFTMVFMVLVEVAAFAATAPLATFAAVCPPTVATTVALCVPVTSPARDPEKLVAVVAVVALPESVAVMVPAEKLPDASRLTIVDAVFKLVAALAAMVAVFTADAVDPPTNETTVAVCVPVTSPERDPEKLVAVVAVFALPLRLAVMVPAEKLPDPSRFTMVFMVFEEVAALAATVAEATLAAVCPPTKETTVTVCVPVTSPDRLPEKLVALPERVAVMVPAEKLPDASLLTMVDAVLVEVAALAAMVAVFTADAVDPPTVATTVAPWVPVTSPEREPEKLVAVPVRFAVIVPAEKLPDASRLTIVDAASEEVAALAAMVAEATAEAV